MAGNDRFPVRETAADGGRVSPRHSSRTKFLIFSGLLLLYGLVFSILFARNAVRFSEASSQITASREAYYNGYGYLSRVNLALRNYANYASQEYSRVYQENREGAARFLSELREAGYGPYSYDLSLICQEYLTLADELVKADSATAPELPGADEEGGTLSGQESTERLQEANHVYSLITSFATYSMDEMEEQLSSRIEAANRDMRERLRLYRITWLVITILTVAAVLMFAEFFLRPLEALTRMASRTSSDNWEIHDSPVTRRDELGLLYDAFYGMMNKIRTQFDELVEKQRLETELQRERENAAQAQALVASTRLKVFQSQINSHFLFNTLNMISRMAYMEHAVSTQNASNLLAQFLRAALSQFGRIVTLEEEFETVGHYIEIQKLRFQDRLIFESDLDPDLAAFTLPAVTLQPLIENAIIHGVSMRRQGFIRYSAELEEGDVVLAVYDDGAGMSPKAVLALKEKLAGGLEEALNEGHGIGLANVCQRLELMFPSRVEPMVESQEGEYTRIGFRIHAGDGAWV